MKIAFVVEKLELGGAESVALSLATQAAADGFTVDVVAIKERGLLEQRVPAVARRVVLDRSRTAGALWSLMRYMRHADADVVVSFGDHVNILTLVAAGLSRRRPKTCVTVHSPYDYTVKTWPGTKRRVSERLIRYLYRRADVVVCVSQGVRRSLAALTGNRVSANVAVIPNPALEAGRISRGPTDFAMRPYRFIFVGRLAEEKDLTTLVSAFASVSAQMDAELLVFGDGPERSRLERLVRECKLSDRVRFRGFEPDLGEIYRGAGCLVLCSRYESFGNVLVEALAHGCRVVSTDCPVGPREVLGAGKWGSLVPVGDAAALARAMLATARKEDEPDEAALAHHLQQFRRDRVFDRYLAALTVAKPLNGEGPSHG